MGGTVLFQDALAARLGVMRPTADDMRRYLASHPPLLSPGIPALVAALKGAGTGVFLVSGGFRLVIHPIAEVCVCVWGGEGDARRALCASPCSCTGGAGF